MQEIGNGHPGLSLAEARTQMALWCLMKSPLLIGASLQEISQPYLQILLNKELIAWNQDSAGIQGYLQASFAYPDGDTRGSLPSREAANMLSHLWSTTELSATEAQISDAFRWVTYCAFGADQDSIPSAQRFTFEPQGVGSALATVRQGLSCLTAPAGGGEVAMAACNGSATQLWSTERAATTLSPIKTGLAGLCLAFDGLRLLAEPCIKRPKNCTSLWNHNSANDGIDCVYSTRQFSEALLNLY